MIKIECLIWKIKNIYILNVKNTGVINKFLKLNSSSSNLKINDEFSEQKLKKN